MDDWIYIYMASIDLIFDEDCLLDDVDDLQVLIGCLLAILFSFLKLILNIYWMLVSWLFDQISAWKSRAFEIINNKFQILRKHSSKSVGHVLRHE